MEIEQEAASVWDERAGGWEDRAEAHTYAKQAFERLEPAVAQHLGGWDGLRVLDFGAGTGLLTERLAPLCEEVVALDLAPKMIEVLEAKRARRGWTNVVPIASSLERATRDRAELAAPFDLIVASSVCSFLPDFAAELSRLRWRLRVGGLFVQWDWHDNVGEWAKGFSMADIESAYASAELEPISIDVGFVFEFEGEKLEVLEAVGQRAGSDVRTASPR